MGQAMGFGRPGQSNGPDFMREELPDLRLEPVRKGIERPRVALGTVLVCRGLQCEAVRDQHRFEAGHGSLLWVAFPDDVRTLTSIDFEDNPVQWQKIYAIME
jgi:hypothetical protein